jgi:MFS family permease
MIVSDGFWGFALGFVVTALSYNFESGANEALVYDSLLLEKKESLYMKIAGRTEVVFQTTGIAALIIGGAAGSIKYEWAYYLAIMLSAVSLVVGLFFKEPRLGEQVKRPKLGTAMKQQYIDSFRAVKNSGRLLYLILFTALLCSSVTLTFFYMQLAWKNSGLSVLEIGILLAVSSLAAAFGAFFAAVSIGLMFFSDIAIVAFCIMNFIEAVIFVATRDYINKSISSDKRATILSFESLMFSLVMILTFPAFGYLSDNIGMGISFVLLGGLMLVLSVANLRLKKAV